MVYQQTKEEDRAQVHIIGVASTDTSIELEVLLESGESLHIGTDMWKLFDEDLEKAMVSVDSKIKGERITQIEKKISVSSERGK